MMIRRTASTALLIIALLLGCADIASAHTHRHHRTPVSATHHRAPNRQERADLATIRGIDPNGGCHLEWDGTWVPAHYTKKGHHVKGHWRNAWYEVICAR